MEGLLSLFLPSVSSVAPLIILLRLILLSSLSLVLAFSILSLRVLVQSELSTSLFTPITFLGQGLSCLSLSFYISFFPVLSLSLLTPRSFYLLLLLFLRLAASHFLVRFNLHVCFFNVYIQLHWRL